MPALGFGVYNIDNRDVVRCVQEAIECGYRLIDTAQWYGNEEGVGRAVAGCGLPREEIFITTKLQSGRRVAESVEESLRKRGCGDLERHGGALPLREAARHRSEQFLRE